MDTKQPIFFRKKYESGYGQTVRKLKCISYQPCTYIRLSSKSSHICTIYTNSSKLSLFIQVHDAKTDTEPDLKRSCPRPKTRLQVWLIEGIGFGASSLSPSLSLCLSSPTLPISSVPGLASERINMVHILWTWFFLLITF
jgi:hypothetical protein